jgi:integrase
LSFRYWLPGNEERWATEDGHLIHPLYEATGGLPRRAANRRRREGLAEGKVLEVDLGQVSGVIRAKRPKRLPVVLNRRKVGAVLGLLDAIPQLAALLLDGAGLRLLDALRLRVHDLDFARHEILVRDGKGQKDRVVNG